MRKDPVTQLWKRLTGKLSRNKQAGEVKVIPRDDHSISRRNISDSALKVMHRLRQGGFEAFLVGGGVRDLLLGGHPKDFDVATDATPEQVKALFRNGRIIGRRFKIVHVRFGREVIEVTTFRAGHDDATRPTQAARSDSGMLLRDNVFGDVEEDARRRDFTINALYYCSQDFTVHDYVGGMDDLNRRLVRMIGDPETRYREDPVRMLRAVRFAAKLDFDIEQHTAAPLTELAPMLEQVPAARLFDEVIKLFMAGRGLNTYALMQRYGLFAPLFPATARLLHKQPEAEALIQQGLVNTDQRVADDKPVTPAFIYAVILWPVVQKQAAALIADGMPEIPALHQASQQVLQAQQQHVAIPRRFSMPMRDIWELQYRLPRRGTKRSAELLEHRYFRAGYDFLLLREQAGEIEPGLGQWWTAYQESSPEHRDAMRDKVRNSQPRTRTRSRKPRNRRRKA